MRSQITSNYAKVLFELGISESVIEESNQILLKNPDLFLALTSPVVPLSEKYAVIDRIFPKEMQNFLKVTCRNQYIKHMDDIYQAYCEYKENEAGVIRATLYYVELPDKKQLEGMKSFINRKYKGNEVNLELIKDESLIGGFILKVGCEEYDWSMKGRFDRLQQKLTRR